MNREATFHFLNILVRDIKKGGHYIPHPANAKLLRNMVNSSKHIIPIHTAYLSCSMFNIL